MRVPLTALLGLLLPLPTTRAAPPTLDALFPAGGLAGTGFTVRHTGKADPWPPQVWCDSPSVTISPAAEKGVLHFRIAPDASPGPCLIRLFSPEGASFPRTFVIGSQPEVSESADNNSPATAEALPPLPLIVNGLLDRRGDTDFFRLRLEAGRHLVARIDAYGLGSPLDPFLLLLHGRGDEIALASISRSLDPVLVHRVSESGDYLLQVAALDHPASATVSFAGSERSVYRLSLAQEEAAPSPLPAPSVQETLTAEGPPQLLPIPSRCEGTLALPGEVDRYRFTAVKDQKLSLRTYSHCPSWLPDLVLRVLRPDSREYRTIDDLTAHAPDPAMEFTAPMDGDYIIEIWDRFRRGDPACRYHLILEEAEPAFSAATKQHSLTLKAGTTVTLPCRLERLHGHDAPLTLRAPGLPEGITLEDLTLPSKTGDFTLTLRAAGDLPPSSQPLLLEITEVSSDSPRSQPLHFSFQTPDSRGPYLIDETPWLWLTLTPP